MALFICENYFFQIQFFLVAKICLGLLVRRLASKVNI